MIVFTRQRAAVVFVVFMMLLFTAPQHASGQRSGSSKPNIGMIIKPEGGTFKWGQRGLGNRQTWEGQDVQNGLINGRGKVVARRGSKVIIVHPPPVIVISPYAVPSPREEIEAPLPEPPKPSLLGRLLGRRY